jgi:GNAT superfamily N-acetyltransferase
MQKTMQDESHISIRPIAVADADAAGRLSAELGYPVAAEIMEERIRGLAAEPNHAVFVACAAGAVVGWIDIGIVRHFQNEPWGEIGGLVVADGFRGAGIGRRLVLRAEQFTRDRGIARMLVRSRIERQDAHRFYLRDGYRQTKTSAVFAKMLSD